MKIRSDSLYARLKPEQRDQLFEWLLVESLGYEEVAALCAEKFGAQPSIGALHGFVARHGFGWKIEQAKAAAAASREALPKNFKAEIARGLAQKQFEAAFANLTVKELAMLKALELDERNITLKEKIEPEKLRLIERRLAAAEQKLADAKNALNKIATRGGITPETLAEIEEAAKLL